MKTSARLMLAHLTAEDVEKHMERLTAAEGSIEDRYERDEINIALGGFLIAREALRRWERMANAREIADEALKRSADTLTRQLESSVLMFRKGAADCERVSRTQDGELVKVTEESESVLQIGRRNGM